LLPKVFDHEGILALKSTQAKLIYPPDYNLKFSVYRSHADIGGFDYYIRCDSEYAELKLLFPDGN
jgi:hypothetical protein